MSNHQRGLHGHQRTHRRSRGQRAGVASVLVLLLAATLTACGGSAASHAGQHHAAPSPVLRIVRLQQYPFAVVDDPRTQRVFVLNGSTVNATLRSGALALSSVSILDSATGALVQTRRVSRPFPLVQDMIIDPRRGNVWLLTVAATTRQGHLTLLDGTTGAFLRSIPAGPDPNGVGIDARARRLFISGDHGVRILDETTGAVLGTVPGNGPPFMVVVEAHHARVRLLSGVQEVVLNERTGAVLSHVSVPTQGDEGPAAFVVDPRVGHLLVSLYDDSTRMKRVCIIALASGKLLHCTDNVGGVPMAVDAATSRAFAVSTPHSSSGGDVTIATLDTRTRRLVRSETLLSAAGAGATASLAVNAHLDRIFAVSEDPSPSLDGYSKLSVLDARSGRIIRTRWVARGTWEASPAVAVDERTGHVFIASTENRTISVLDATRL